MGVKITLDAKAIKGIEDAMLRAAELTMEALKTDVISEQVMPYNVGTMQDTDTFVGTQQDGDTIKSSLVTGVTGSPQARRLYYHPEYNFQQGENHNAGGKWLQPWIDGDKKDFIQDTFAELLKKEADL